MSKGLSMAAQPPVLKNPIPPQVTHEGAAFGPFDFAAYFQTPSESGKLRFSAELADGRPLPQGLMCTQDGLLNGIPASGTEGRYAIQLTVRNDSAQAFIAEFEFTIKPRLKMDDAQSLNNLKSRVWEALGKNLPLPEMSDVLSRPISAIEIYYLLQRWATLTIWDGYNFDMTSGRVELKIAGQSKHYKIYDKGNCLIAAPVDLFSYERTLDDALQTARALAREVFNRGWAVEFAGFDKMVRAAWVELQLLGDTHDRKVEILHYVPSQDDLKMYVNKMRSEGPQIT